MHGGKLNKFKVIKILDATIKSLPLKYRFEYILRDNTKQLLKTASKIHGFPIEIGIKKTIESDEYQKMADRFAVRFLKRLGSLTKVLG